MLSRARAFSSTQRMERSSSTIQTGFIGGSIFLFDACVRHVFQLPLVPERSLPFSLRSTRIRLSQRQHDRETCPARHAIEINRALMLFNKALCDRQAQPRTSFTPRHERVENLVADIVRYARTVVDHLQFQ